MLNKVVNRNQIYPFPFLKLYREMYKRQEINLEKYLPGLGLNEVPVVSQILCHLNMRCVFEKCLKNEPQNGFKFFQFGSVETL